MSNWGPRMLSGCIGALGALAIMYVAVMGRFVTREEVSSMIQVESPYIQDAKLIAFQLSAINAKLDELLKQ